MTDVAAVGVIVNPWAGKDLRRLHAPTGHTPDAAKVGILRRVVIAALDAGASAVLVADDVSRIAARAVHGIDGAALVEGPGTGSALDTRRAATSLHDAGCRPIVVLGGDGTCRDAAMGAPDALLLAVSTGTNNVFPRFVDGTSAGTAAGLVAGGLVPWEAVSARAKQIHVEVVDGHASHHDIALVDVGLIDAARTGARAVLRASSVRAVVAAMATPASTGLSAVAGRVAPVRRGDDGGVLVTLDGSDRLVRVPLVPGTVDDLAVADVVRLADGQAVVWTGPGVLAYDGERDRVLSRTATVTVSVRRDGPWVLDVERTLACAVRRRLFDRPAAVAPLAKEGIDD